MPVRLVRHNVHHALVETWPCSSTMRPGTWHMSTAMRCAHAALSAAVCNPPYLQQSHTHTGSWLPVHAYKLLVVGH
eukprot:359590-Chlamydomonas_euryale.AAC.19